MLKSEGLGFFIKKLTNIHVCHQPLSPPAVVTANGPVLAVVFCGNTCFGGERPCPWSDAVEKW